MSDFRLMIAGPVDVDDEVLSALAEPTLPHYGQEWMAILSETFEMLQHLFQTHNDILVIPGPGSSAFEMALASMIPQGHSLVMPSNGFFGQRMRDIAESRGIGVHMIEFPMGQPVDPATVRDQLPDLLSQADAAGAPIRAMGLIHHETSTGILNPLQEVAAVSAEFDLPLVVDAVSSLGGVSIPVDEWGIDVVVTVANKCIAVPPAVAIMSVSDRVWQMAGENPTKHGWYQNLNTWKWYIENWGDWHPHPTTMPTNSVVALHRRLKRIEQIGLEGYFAAIHDAAAYFRSEMAALGFELLPDPAFAAPMLSALKTRPDVDPAEMLRYIVEHHGLMASGGLADLRGKIIRVGHMGRASEMGYVEGFLDGVRAYLKVKELGATPV